MKYPLLPITTTLAAPRIRFDDPALRHRPIRLRPLPDSFKADLVEAPEVVVEVFRRTVSLRTTSILEDIDPYPAFATRPDMHSRLRSARNRHGGSGPHCSFLTNSDQQSLSSSA